MAYPTIFANLAQGNQPLSLFDAMFAIVAQISTIPCTATGQNAIVLTPIGNAPTLAAYARFNTFSFKAVATSNAAVTAQFSPLAALPVYKRDGVTQVAANDVVSGQFYYLVYDSALNAGGGGFYIEISTFSVTTPAVGGSFSNLKITNDGATPDTKIAVTADEVILVDPSSGNSVRGASQSWTINTASVGVVNGLDAGSLAASTWYYVWSISNGATIGGLISLSSTAPTMPAGYTYRKRLGALRTDITAGQTATITTPIASPGVVNWTAHGLTAGTPWVPTVSGGALPTGLVAGTTYYVIAAGLGANVFETAATPNGAAINFTGTSTGTQTGTVPGVRFMRTLQLNRTVQYVIVAPPASTIFAPIVASGAAGTYSLTSPVLTAVSVANVVPPTAATILVMGYTNWRAVGAGGVLVAPNTTWGGTNNGPRGTIGMVWPISLDTITDDTGGAEIVLEGTTIAWAANAAGGVVACRGFTDNL